MSDLWDDPDFIQYIDYCIDTTGFPPSTFDIMLWIEARASVAIDEKDGTYRV